MTTGFHRRVPKLPAVWAAAAVLAAACGREGESSDEDRWDVPCCDTADISADVPAPETRVDCAAWKCRDGTYPEECFKNPTASLWMEPEELDKLFRDVEADVEADGVFFLHGRCMVVGVEIHGGISVNYEKKSFKIKFNRGERFPLDPFVEDPEEVPAEDPVGYKQLILKAHWIDPSLMRDKLTQDLLSTIGGLAPRVTYVNFMLNGEYQGVYALTEAIETDFFQRLGMEGTGNLYKAVSHYANFGWKEDFMAGFEKKANVAEPSQDLEELFLAIKQAPATFEAFQETVEPLLDLDLYLRFTAANMISSNQDSFTKNYYLYHEAAAASHPFLIVNWDADATWGRSWEGSLVPAAEGTLWATKNKLSAKLSAIPEYQAKYLSLLRQVLGNACRYEASAARLAAAADQLRDDIRFEECRWPDKISTFDAEIELIDAFLLERAAYLAELLSEQEKEEDD